MRIAVLQTAAGKQVVFRDQRLDDAVIGVTLLAVIVHDTGGTAFGRRAETGGVFGVETVIADRERDLGGDTARFQIARLRHPRVKVLAAMAGGCVHEAGTGIVCDVIAIENRNREGVTQRCQRVGAGNSGELLRLHIAQACEFELRLGKAFGCQLVCEDELFARLRSEIIGRRRDLIKAIGDA